ncbi:MAG: spore germination protein, partial [Clostridia bacterium]|nr:spore germination protein [Clostridia bacterium]
MVKDYAVRKEDFKLTLQQEFSSSDDLFFREVDTDTVHAVLCFLDGGSDKLLLEQNVIKPLLSCDKTLSSAT